VALRSDAGIRPLLGLLLLAGSAFASPARGEPSYVVNVYSWAEYFPPSMLRKFEAETGIKVNYSVMDSNDVMETTLSAGHSGFDLVTVNASPHLGREIPKHLWQKLDKARLRNLANVDATILRALRRVDPDNAYAIPWMWGTVGVMFNPDMVRPRLPPGRTRSIDMVFKPEVIARLKDCGVTVLDSWVDILPMLSAWLGQPELSTDPASLDSLAAAYRAIRPSIRRVTTSGYYQQLAEGESCVAIGYSGDAMIARRLVAEAGGTVKVEYAYPEGMVAIFVDSFAIPVDAPHPDAAHVFIDFALRPEIAAEAAAYIGFASGNAAAIPLLEASMRENPAIYPPVAVRERFSMGRAYTPAEERTFARAWLRMKTGH
jgi:putrescine transport system substrate-binding protein